MRPHRRAIVFEPFTLELLVFKLIVGHLHPLRREEGKESTISSTVLRGKLRNMLRGELRNIDAFRNMLRGELRNVSRGAFSNILRGAQKYIVIRNMLRGELTQNDLSTVLELRSVRESVISSPRGSTSNSSILKCVYCYLWTVALVC